MGVLTVVLSLIFVGIELRQATSVARSDAYHVAMSNFGNLYSNFIVEEEGLDVLIKIMEGTSYQDLDRREQVLGNLILNTTLTHHASLYYSIEEGILPEEMLDFIGNGGLLGAPASVEMWELGLGVVTEEFGTYLEQNIFGKDN